MSKCVKGGFEKKYRIKTSIESISRNDRLLQNNIRSGVTTLSDYSIKNNKGTQGMETFEFDMETFVTDTEEQDFSLDPQTQLELAAMLPHYPELAHWTQFAFFVAWGAYSQDIYAVSWVYWLTRQRDEGFLAYCYVSQRWPDFDFGGTGLYDEDIQQLANLHPWNCYPQPPAPEWLPHRYR